MILWFGREYVPDGEVSVLFYSDPARSDYAASKRWSLPVRPVEVPDEVVLQNKAIEHLDALFPFQPPRVARHNASTLDRLAELPAPTITQEERLQVKLEQAATMIEKFGNGETMSPDEAKRVAGYLRNPAESVDTFGVEMIDPKPVI